MIDLHIFGTSHNLQCGVEPWTLEAIESFKEEIIRLCRKSRICRIEEEMSCDGLARHGVQRTVAHGVAGQLQIEHHYVDLTADERTSLSLGDGPVLATIRNRFFPYDRQQGFREAMSNLEHGVRERIWVTRMLTRTEWPTLFICGAIHAEPIRRIWTALGLDATTVHHDYEPSGG